MSVVTHQAPQGVSITIQRIKLGIRQFDLAAKAGLHPSRLSQIETGRITPSPEELSRIREALSGIENEAR